MSNSLSQSLLTLTQVADMLGFPTGTYPWSKNKRALRHLRGLEKNSGKSLIITTYGPKGQPMYRVPRNVMEEILNPIGYVCVLDEINNLKKTVIDLKLRIETLEAKRNSNGRK